MTQDDTCGYPTAEDTPCQHPACRPDGRCWLHTGHDDLRANGGAPTKLTKQRQEGMAAMVESGHSQAAAARAYGIQPQTFTEWLRRGEQEVESIYAEFAERIARAKAESERDYVETLRHMAEEVGDPNTLRWMLQQRFPESWSESDAIGSDSTSSIVIHTEADDERTVDVDH